MNAELDALRTAGLLDPGVLALGLERGWVTPQDVSAFAVECLAAGADRPEAVELAMAEELEPRTIVELLRKWTGTEKLPSLSSEQAIRRWTFARLTTISESAVSPDEKLDRLEEAYAILGYPEEMRECSRYYIPPHDRARGIGVGDITASPLGAMDELLSRLRAEFNVQ